jgi:hypothetical protein
LRQGDLLAPLLFNLVADMVAILTVRAKEDGQVDLLIPHLKRTLNMKLIYVS